MTALRLAMLAAVAACATQASNACFADQPEPALGPDAPAWAPAPPPSEDSSSNSLFLAGFGQNATVAARSISAAALMRLPELADAPSSAFVRVLYADDVPSAPPPVASDSEAELAKKTLNPVANLISVPVPVQRRFRHRAP